MNWALFTKELRALRPMLHCIVGLWVLSCLYLVVIELPDAQSVKPEQWLEKSRDGTFMVLMLFSLMIGAGLLPSENDQGTLRFLDGLPLSRTRLFVWKTVAALLVVTVIPVIDLIGSLGFDFLSRTSVEGPYPWRFSLVISGLEIVVGFFLLSQAMLISFVRSWFALVAGLLFWTYLWLRQLGIPGIAYIDPYALLAPGMPGGVIQVPWPQIGAHLAAGILCLVAAWWGFRRLGDDAQRATERNPLLRGFGIGLKLAGPLLWLGAMVYFGTSAYNAEEKESRTPVGEASFSRQETRRYEFLFRTAQQEDARALIWAADGVYDQVRAFLEAPQAPGRLVVDLASPVISHATGQTNWTKIRMPLTPDLSLYEQRRILGHETTHAFIEQFGAGRLQNRFGSIRCIHEGLATYVEEAVFAPEQAPRHRRAVAGAWSRGKVPFALLVDDHALSQGRDPNLVYPLGAELAGAMIDAHGHGAPGRFLRAVGRPAAPPGLKGVDLWRDALQAAGLSFERIVAGYEARCAEIAAAEKDFVASLPRITAQVAVEGGEIVVRPQFDGKAPGRMVCFAEDNEPFGIGVQALHRRKDGAFTLDRAGYLKSSLRYMLGWHTPQTQLPVFEPWAEAAL